MNKRTKMLWLNALRSGKYKQAVGYLHHIGYEIGIGEIKYCDMYCCLGVLVAASGFNMGDLVPNVDPDEHYSLMYNEENMPDGYTQHILFQQEEAEYLSVAAKEYFGISIDIHDQAAKMNDEGHDFLEIADWLESVL